VCRWTAADTAVLDQIIAAVLAADDTSDVTILQCALLLLNVLRGPLVTWAAAAFGQLWPRLKYYCGRGGRLSPQALAALDAEFGPLTEGMEMDALLNLSESVFCGQVQGAPTVLRALEKAALAFNYDVHSNAGSTIARIARLLCKHAVMPHWGPILMARDPLRGGGIAGCPPLRAFLLRERQDLLPLETLLAFFSLSAREALRLTPAARAAYVQHQAKIVNLTALAKVPGPSSSVCIELVQGLAVDGDGDGDGVADADVDTPDALRARLRAVRVLGHSDEPEAIVPCLMHALCSQHARGAAVVALGKALAFAPASQVVQVLAAAPKNRAAVVRGLVELATKLPTAYAVTALLTLGDACAHLDVQADVGTALFAYLQYESARDMLSRMARSPVVAVASVVAKLPLSGLDHPEAQAWATAMLTQCLKPGGKPQVHEAAVQHLLVCPRVAGGLPPAVLGALLDTLRDHSGTPQDTRSAAGKVLVLHQAWCTPDMIGHAIMCLLPPEHRRALDALVAEVQGAVESDPVALQPCLCAVLTALALDDLTAHLQVRLAARSADRALFGSLLQRLAAAGEALHMDVLSEAVRAVEAKPDSLGDDVDLGESPDPRLRRVALAALRARGDLEGWSPALRHRLALFAADPHPLVASAAQFTFVPGTFP